MILTLIATLYPRTNSVEALLFLQSSPEFVFGWFIANMYFFGLTWKSSIRLFMFLQWPEMLNNFFIYKFGISNFSFDKYLINFRYLYYSLIFKFRRSDFYFISLYSLDICSFSDKMLKMLVTTLWVFSSSYDLLFL